MMPRLESLMPLVKDAAQPSYRGRVDVISGILVEAAGLPAALGELCRIDRGALEGRQAQQINIAVRAGALLGAYWFAAPMGLTMRYAGDVDLGQGRFVENNERAVNGAANFAVSQER